MGSNIAPRVIYLEKTRFLIAQNISPLLSVSPIFKTQSWGYDSYYFLNQCIEIQTDIPILHLQKQLQIIENTFEKKINTSSLYSDRKIDIDILLFGDKLLNFTPNYKHSQLCIPHPFMHLRNFVLKPLCMIAPQIIHPFFKKNISQLHQICLDTSELTIFET